MQLDLTPVSPLQFCATCLTPMQLSQIGLLVFDEAHHCSADHPYAQIMEDLYQTADIGSRSQIVGLTASPGE